MDNTNNYNNSTDTFQFLIEVFLVFIYLAICLMMLSNASHLRDFEYIIFSHGAIQVSMLDLIVIFAVFGINFSIFTFLFPKAIPMFGALAFMLTQILLLIKTL